MYRYSTMTCIAVTLTWTILLASNNNAIAFAPRGNIFKGGTRPVSSITQITTATTSPIYAAAIDSDIISAEQFDSSQDMQKKREDLKKLLLDAADIYKAKQATDDLLGDTMEANATRREEEEPERSYVYRLLSRIVRKVSRKTNNTTNKPKVSTKRPSKNILSKEKFRTAKLDTGKDGEAIIALAKQLAELNPTTIPTLGFKGYGGVDPTESKLDGRWKLRFTTAADATFPESPTRGKSTTSQEIDTIEGTFTNVVDFEKGKIEGFRVVVNGEAASDDEIDLSFSKVTVLRRSRFPRLFGRLTLRLPSKLIRRLSSGRNTRGPYKKLLYVDDDLRIHESGTGNLFIQSRIE